VHRDLKLENIMLRNNMMDICIVNFFMAETLGSAH